MKARWRGAALLCLPLCVAAQELASLYEDRLMDPARLGPDQGDGLLLERFDPAGPPRRLSVELRAQSERIDGGPSLDTRWVVARGMLDSDNFGAFTLDAAARLGPQQGPRGLLGGRSASFTLAQRRMPVGNGWLAAHGLGLVSTGLSDLLAQQVRIGVPTRLVQGAAAEWTQERAGWALAASTGEPVTLDPLGQGGLTPSGGRASSLGVRRHLGPAWSFAAQIADQRAGDGPSSHAGLAALRWEGAQRFWQVNVLQSRERGEDARTGAWLDAALVAGASEHRLGLNWLPERQQWLGIPMASGAVGGGYRWRWRSRQLMLEAQFDRQHLRDNARPSPSDVTQAWASLRRQIDQSTAWGAQAFGSTSGEHRQSHLLAFREQFDERASWRAFAEVDARTGEGHGWQLGLGGHTLLAETRVGGAFAVLRRGSGPAGSDLSMTLDRDLGDRLALRASARRFVAPGEHSPARSLTASVEWRLAPGWRLSASVNDSRGAQLPFPTGPGAGPPDVLAPVFTTPRLRLTWLALRYDMSAGTPSVALGGAPGGGGGRIDGSVFLDANGNGVADPGEPLLPNVTLVLDERYAVRTDAQGRFEFPFVATGPHALRVLPDNIPLPWGMGDAPVRSVSVERRITATVNVGVLRQ